MRSGKGGCEAPPTPPREAREARGSVTPPWPSLHPHTPQPCPPGCGPPRSVVSLEVVVYWVSAGVLFSGFGSTDPGSGISSIALEDSPPFVET